MAGKGMLAAIAALGALAVSGAAQAAINGADIGNNLLFVQTGPGTVVPPFADNAFFFGRTFYDNTSDFDGGTMTSPTTVDYPYNSLAADCCGGFGGQYQTGYLSRAAMDSAFPLGTYTLTATNSVTSASQSVSIDMTASYLDLMPTPMFDNATVATLSHLSAGAGPVVSFNTFTPEPGAFGQIFLSVFDVTNPSFYGGFVGPSVSTTSFDLSGINFVAGDSYLFELIFDQGQSGSSGGVPVTARSNLRTDFYSSIATPAAVPEPSAWALIILGFGAMGGALRRRRMVPA